MNGCVDDKSSKQGHKSLQISLTYIISNDYCLTNAASDEIRNQVGRAKPDLEIIMSFSIYAGYLISYEYNLSHFFCCCFVSFLTCENVSYLLIDSVAAALVCAAFFHSVVLLHGRMAVRHRGIHLMCFLFTS